MKDIVLPRSIIYEIVYDMFKIKRNKLLNTFLNYFIKISYFYATYETQLIQKINKKSKNRLTHYKAIAGNTQLNINWVTICAITKI